jgi:hypothetical protein
MKKIADLSAPMGVTIIVLLVVISYLIYTNNQNQQILDDQISYNLEAMQKTISNPGSKAGAKKMTQNKDYRFYTNDESNFQIEIPQNWFYSTSLEGTQFATAERKAEVEKNNANCASKKGFCKTLLLGYGMAFSNKAFAGDIKKGTQQEVSLKTGVFKRFQVATPSGTETYYEYNLGGKTLSFHGYDEKMLKEVLSTLSTAE